MRCIGCHIGARSIIGHRAAESPTLLYRRVLGVSPENGYSNVALGASLGHLTMPEQRIDITNQPLVFVLVVYTDVLVVKI